jgi:acid phosphatase
VPPGAATRVTKVLTFVLENEDAGPALARMPRLAALARAHGQATDYRAATHPSLPNYLDLAFGTTGGVADDGPPAQHPMSVPTVFDRALAAGATAATYADGMPSACSLAPAGRYAVKHNPWAYAAAPALRAACRQHDLPAGSVDAGALHDAVVGGTLPQVGLVVPDLCHDGHDCPLGQADAWLAAWTDRVQQGPDWKAGRLAVVVTFDEGTTGGPNRVLTVVAAPSLHGVVVSTPLTHLSWSRWMTDLVGAAPVGDARAATSLGAAFGLPT